MGGKMVTFREWSENFAKINYNLVGWVEITCRLKGNRILFSKDENVYKRVKHQSNNVLLDLYRKHFDVIQLNYQSLLEDFDNYKN